MITYGLNEWGMRNSKVLEWTQTVLGLFSAFVLASNPDQYWGFTAMVAFLVKDLAMIWFCRMHGFNGLIYSAVGYTFIDIFGIYRWWIF